MNLKRASVLAATVGGVLSFSAQGAQAATALKHIQIFGSPVTAATVTRAYEFTPATQGTSGRHMSFSVSQKPSWASFNPNNGSLAGTPGANDVRTFSNIVITVSDETGRSTLPGFSIKVAPRIPQQTTSTPSNRAPTISGKPVLEMTTAQAFNFVPSAKDADGDKLSFSVDSKPSWASFDAITGRLSGTPTASQVGSYEEIQISVSDGKTVARLPQFAINVVAAEPVTHSVTLSWLPPMQNEDGSALTNLAGYRIVYGTKSGEYSKSIAVATAGLTRFAVENLDSGNYYFALIAVNSQGIASTQSQEVAVNLM
jgi:hypothetical protein